MRNIFRRLKTKKMRIVQNGNPALRRVSEPVAAIDDDIRQLADKMTYTLMNNDVEGVGLAAPQVGVNKRVIVIHTCGDNKKDKSTLSPGEILLNPMMPITLINPELVSLSPETICSGEGCLSLPGVGGDVTRAARVVLKATLLDGQVVQVPVDAPFQAGCETIDPKEFAAYKDNFRQPFNRSEGPLYRATVVRSGDSLYLLTDFHHLVFDGRSYDLFITQLTEALAGKAPVPEIYTYFDYVQDQQEMQQSEAYTAARDFFAARMTGCEGASGLLPDRSSEEPGHEALLTKKVGADIAQRCLDLNISPASYYLAAAFQTVAAFCGNRKVYLCTISNGRSDLRTADTFGMFVNTLALSSEIGHGSVDEYLKETDQQFAETLRHEYYPFAQVAADFDFQPQVMLAYQVGVLAK